MEKSQSIRRLLRPRSIAVVGASTRKKALANVVIENLSRGGFSGPIHIIHPEAAEVDGHRAMPSLEALPFGVDCVVLAIPASSVLAAVRVCAERGVGGVIIFSAGFAEAGADGQKAQDTIRRIAEESGMAIVGPNCLGIMNFVDNIALTFSATDFLPVARPAIGIASQSGAMAAVLRGALHGRDRAVSYAISTGNEAANGIEDFIDFLIKDPNTRVIAIIAEHIRDARRFLAQTDAAHLAGKPMVLLHPGRSSAARDAAKTHTGALAGDHDVMRAMVVAQGVIFVDTLEELVDITEFLSLNTMLDAQGLGIIGESGALSAMMLDYCDSHGVPLPAPDGPVAAALDAMAPGFIRASNPLDLTAQAMTNPDIYRQSLAAFEADDRIGVIMLSISLTSRTMADRKLAPLFDILRLHPTRKPLIFAMIGDDADIGQENIAALRALGLPFLRSPERAVRMLRSLSRASGRVETAPLLSGSHVTLQSGMTSEANAKSALRTFGFDIADFRLAQSVDEAVTAGNALGYPVALKVQSAALPHKSDVGGVVLNLADENAVRAGWAQIQEALTRSAPGVPIDGILVERMAPRGLELIVGARNDPDWGPVLVFGLGGVLTELLADIRILPAEASEAAIHAALLNLKGASLFTGFRGSLPSDLKAVARVMRRLGAFAANHPELADVEINPLLVYPEGQGVRIVDALISVNAS